MSGDLADAFAAFKTLEVGPLADGWQADEFTKRDRMPGRPKGDKPPLTQAEKNAKRASAIEARQRRANMAILDMETDPFDNIKRDRINPFLCVLYSPRFDELGVATDPGQPGCHIIWEENHDELIARVVEFIEGLPEKFTVYAHNGGKFDYMFLVSRLRGAVSFKGRGIMSAKVNGHELRDSLLVIPESLANIQKDAFDYHNMQRGKRARFRDEITRYCVSDCRYLYGIVDAFRSEFGPRLTIGQAGLGELRKHYKIKPFREGWDGYIRQYYFGGRVECIEGAGDFRGDYKMYDINSSYPNVMAKFKHPVGDFFDYTLRTGDPSDDTCFVDLDCLNSGPGSNPGRPGGALIGRDAEGRTTARLPHGRFMTTIHEFEVARRYGLISNVKINFCVDCRERTTFAKFVLPLYDRRQMIKGELQAMKARGGEGSQAWYDLARDSLFVKLILNSCYGKTGQNPRNFKDHWITDPHQAPPGAWLASIADLASEADRILYGDGPEFMDERYWIWTKPAPRHTYNNVGVAASVTGAARAVLLEAMQHADGAIYCDTDSLICRSLDHVPGVIDIDATRLGAWNLDDTSSRVLIVGKKTYGLWHDTPKVRTLAQLRYGLAPDFTIKSKGVPTGGLAWHDLLAMLNGQSTLTVNRAPTLDRFGRQRYIEREIRATAPAWMGHREAAAPA
jgi:hypothetical protein